MNNRSKNCKAIFGAALLATVAFTDTAVNAGAGNCTICVGCPGGASICYPGGTSTTACTDMGCGASDTSTECVDVGSCPDSEAGQCDDGLNNDAYQNELTDCADPACSGDPACANVPAVSTWALAIMAILLTGAATILAARRRHA